MTILYSKKIKYNNKLGHLFIIKYRQKMMNFGRNFQILAKNTKIWQIFFLKCIFFITLFYKSIILSLLSFFQVQDKKKLRLH